MLPVFVVIGSRQQVQRPFFVGRHEFQLRLSLADRHTLQPVGEARRTEVQCPIYQRVGFESGLRIGRRVPERPRQKTQFQRPTLPHGRLVRVGPAHIRHHRREVFRPQRRHRRLRPPRPRRAPRTDLAIAPLLPVDPRQRIEAVFGLRHQEIDIALGPIGPPTILAYRHIPPLRKKTSIAAISFDIALVIGRAVKNSGKLPLHPYSVPRGKIQIRRQSHPIPHFHHNIFSNYYIVEIISHLISFFLTKR